MYLEMENKDNTNKTSCSHVLGPDLLALSRTWRSAGESVAKPF